MTMSLGATNKFLTNLGTSFPFDGITYSNALNSWYMVSANTTYQTANPIYNVGSAPQGNYSSNFTTTVWSSRTGGLNLITATTVGNGTVLGDNTIRINPNSSVKVNALTIGQPIQFSTTTTNIGTQTTYYVSNIFVGNNSISIANSANLRSTVVLSNTNFVSQLLDWIPGARLGSYDAQAAPAGGFNSIRTFGNSVVTVGAWGNVRTVNAGTGTNANSWRSSISVTGCDSTTDSLYANNTSVVGTLNVGQPITFYNSFDTIQANTVYYVSNISNYSANYSGRLNNSDYGGLVNYANIFQNQLSYVFASQSWSTESGPDWVYTVTLNPGYTIIATNDQTGTKTLTSANGAIGFYVGVTVSGVGPAEGNNGTNFVIVGFNYSVASFTVSATQGGPTANIQTTLTGLNITTSTWNPINSNINVNFQDIAYDGNSTYVICGDAGYLQVGSTAYGFGDPKIANGAALVSVPTTLELFNSSANATIPQVTSGTFQSLGVLPTGQGDMLWVKTSN
jgi:hypothetical protein